MICEHYRCEITERTCLARQNAPNAAAPGSQRRMQYALANGHCVSGECEQGLDVRRRAEADPESFRPSPRRRFGKATRAARPAGDRRRKIPTTPAGWKWCNRCRKVRRLDHFNRNQRTKDGLQWECRPCQAERAREYEARNRLRRDAANAGRSRMLGQVLPLAEVRRRHALRALRLSGGNIARAASALGITRQTLARIARENQTGAKPDERKRK